MIPVGKDIEKARKQYNASCRKGMYHEFLKMLSLHMLLKDIEAADCSVARRSMCN
jgi:hypothetical protein